MTSGERGTVGDTKLQENRQIKNSFHLKSTECCMSVLVVRLYRFSFLSQISHNLVSSEKICHAIFWKQNSSDTRASPWGSPHPRETLETFQKLPRKCSSLICQQQSQPRERERSFSLSLELKVLGTSVINASLDVNSDENRRLSCVFSAQKLDKSCDRFSKKSRVGHCCRFEAFKKNTATL